MSRKLKKRMRRVGIGAAVYLAAALFSHLAPDKNRYVELALFLAAYGIIGGDVVKKAVQNIGHGRGIIGSPA